ncbi:MAG: radical SAM protein [Desulfobacterota bacterium]|nr:radical SAM protein [Thermodesulfobacteriota bacterium]
MKIREIIKKSRAGDLFSKDELVQMLRCPSDSSDSYLLMAEANRISKELTSDQAEVHAQFALNLAPCPRNCAFCSFARRNRIFNEETRISPEQAIHLARQFEAEGANAIYVMTTATYPFDLFLEMSREIRRNLKPETTLVANIGDQSRANAQKVKDVGYVGVYHALRLREGTDTSISPKTRQRSIRNFLDAGLGVGTCVEPVGPEHSNEEIAEMIIFTGSFNPSFSGAARRISIPATALARLGMISELRMAQIVAVTRLGVPRTVMGNCTHEPCTLGAMAGANLFWAEMGANPRDTTEKTEEGRGETVKSCEDLFWEAGWSAWAGPSRYYPCP